jgi:hypothetical protein
MREVCSGLDRYGRKMEEEKKSKYREVETVVSKNCGMGLTDAAFPISYSQSEK